MQRLGRVRWVLALVLLLNLTVALAKFVVGWLTQSLTITADSFHSLMDTASNVVGLIGVSLALAPPDVDHPYGHHKFETLASLGIAGLLFVTCFEIIQSLVERIMHPVVPEITALSFGVMIGTMAINIGVATYERREGKRLRSDLLIADSAHTLSDVLVSFSVILTLAGTALGFTVLDLVGAVVIVGVIAYVGFTILRHSSAILSDTAAFSEEVVMAVACATAGVQDCHAVRTRLGPTISYIDLHLEVDPRLSVSAAHDIAAEVERRLVAELGVHDVVIHLDPGHVHEGGALPHPDGRRGRP
ncbi:MAG: cation transporter [Chloroflexi bacterium]|nr:cation transporter [Chloroflexota bacterium]